MVEREVLPAYRRYLEALKEHRPSATETIGLSALPDGERMYAAQILAWTTLPLDREGGARARPRGAGEDPGGAGGGRGATRLRRPRLGDRGPRGGEPRLVARGAGPDRARPGRAELGGGAGDVRPHARRRTARCGPSRSSGRRTCPFAFYNPPTADGSRAGVYYINTYQPEHRPLHQLASTTHHEANPGHHFQIAIEREQADRPPLKRFGGILAGSAFIEGWGLYSERLADEMGLYRNDYERLGMLDSQGFRACRLIVDTGIHALGWDRERVRRADGAAGVPELDATIEVDRYIALPGQALAYMMGQLEIRACRERAADAANVGVRPPAIPRPAAVARFGAAADAAPGDGPRG